MSRERRSLIFAVNIDVNMIYVVTQKYCLLKKTCETDAGRSRVTMVLK